MTSNNFYCEDCGRRFTSQKGVNSHRGARGKCAARKAKSTDEAGEGTVSFATTADRAIDAERRQTMGECLAFLREGDREACHFRLMRGFERQVRMAGLEKLVREGEMHEEPEERPAFA